MRGLVEEERRAEPRGLDAGMARGTWVLAVLTAAGFLLGVFWLREWLWYELTRREPMHMIATLVGEATALFWFGHFVVTWGFLGRPIASVTDSRKGLRASTGWFFLTCVFAIGLDLCGTLWLWHVDKERFAESTVTAGTVGRVARIRTGGIWWAYIAHCRYEDDGGGEHRAVFEFKENTALNAFKGDVPKPLTRKLKSGKTHFAMQVCYDPAWPNRSWVVGVDYDEQVNRRPYVWSIVVLEVQLIGLMIAGAVIRKSSGTTKTHALALVRFFPLMSETFVLFIAGLLSTFVFVP